jgi:hypothetical protein
MEAWSLVAGASAADWKAAPKSAAAEKGEKPMRNDRAIEALLDGSASERSDEAFRRPLSSSKARAVESSLAS